MKNRLRQHILDLKKTLTISKKLNMQLNSLKCTFGTGFTNFFVFSTQPKKNQNKSKWSEDNFRDTFVKKYKGAAKFTCQITQLNRFISKSWDKHMPLHKALRGAKHFSMHKNCENTFKQLKSLIFLLCFKVHNWEKSYSCILDSVKRL